MISDKGNLRALPTPDQYRDQKGLPRAQRAIKRTSAGLRNALFDEIDALRAGDGDPERALAVAKIAQNILQTAKLELQYRAAGIPMKEQLKEITLGDSEPDDVSS